MLNRILKYWTELIKSVIKVRSELKIGIYNTPDHFVFRRYSPQEIFFIRVWYLGQESIKKNNFAIYAFQNKLSKPPFFKVSKPPTMAKNF